MWGKKGGNERKGDDGYSDREETRPGKRVSLPKRHDIGKLWIPDSILQEPGRLTGRERSLMENHTIYGAEVMAHIDSQVFSLGSLIALTHHERWDGTGYPSGLKGEEVPISGRIVALADVFDALTSARPYMKAWSAASAFREIRGDSGTQFDPLLVDCLMDAADEIIDCKEAG